MKESVRPWRRRLVIGAIVVTAGVAATGLARALWSASGTGPGSAQVVTAQAITIAAAASPTADLYPGGSGALQFTIANPNPYPISLTSVSYGAVSSSDQANCPASNVTLAADGTLSSAIPVAGDASATAASIPNALTLASSAPNGCQGVTFTVAITLSGMQT